MTRSRRRRRGRPVRLLCRRAPAAGGRRGRLFDALPTPYGLVRAGVAPDHPKIKSVTRMYERTAEHAGFRFFGGVEFGADVTREELLERYHAVVYAVGTPTDKPARDSRRRPSRVGRRHRVRRLVQRPPGPRGRDVRPVLRARRGDRQRERGARRRPDAGARPGRARADRHRRPCASRRSPPPSVKDVVVLGRRGPGAGDVHESGAARARRAGARRRRRRRGRARSPTFPATSSPTARRNVAILRELRGASAGRAIAPDRAALLPLAGRDPRRRQDGPVTGLRVVRNRLERTPTAASGRWRPASRR